MSYHFPQKHSSWIFRASNRLTILWSNTYIYKPFRIIIQPHHHKSWYPQRPGQPAQYALKISLLPLCTPCQVHIVACSPSIQYLRTFPPPCMINGSFGPHDPVGWPLWYINTIRLVDGGKSWCCQTLRLTSFKCDRGRARAKTTVDGLVGS
jgi:hypothetical protein